VQVDTGSGTWKRKTMANPQAIRRKSLKKDNNFVVMIVDINWFLLFTVQTRTEWVTEWNEVHPILFHPNLFIKAQTKKSLIILIKSLLLFTLTIDLD